VAVVVVVVVVMVVVVIALVMVCGSGSGSVAFASEPHQRRGGGRSAHDSRSSLLPCAYSPATFLQTNKQTNKQTLVQVPSSRPCL
jgi:hypothetical protein